MDLPIVLDVFSDSPLWKQLFEALCLSIEQGQLRNGDSLPPTREMAKKLKVSRDTIVRAYAELVSRGYAEATTGAGTFVKYNHVRTVAVSNTSMELDGLSEFGRRVMEMELAGATCADFSGLNYGAAPANLLPTKQWRDIISHQNGLQQPESLEYESETFGYRPLREEIAAYLRRTRALNCTADQVVVFSDSQQALDLLSRILINPGDGAVVENPGYSGVREMWRSHGAQIFPVDIDQDGMRVEDLFRLPEKCKLLYTTPSHHDPTGVVMPVERRRRLLSWARANGAFVLEDGFDSDYRYGSMNLPSIQSLDGDGRVIYLYSFWKVLYPIVTVGCAVLPPSLVPVFERAKLMVKRNYAMTEHCALSEFVAEGHLERHIRKTHSIYVKRRQSVIFALAQNFRGLISYPKESAGLHLTVRFDESFSEEELESAAQQACLPMVSTRRYYVGEALPREYMIPFASLPETISGDLIRQMAELLKIGNGRCA